MNKEDLSERIIGLMADGSDRQRYGGTSQPKITPPTQLPAGEAYLFETEKQVHQDLENWLNQREYFYDHQRMDKRTSNRKGIPDFVVGICALMVCIEFKVGGRKLTAEQEEWRRKAMEKSRVQYHVFDNAGDAIHLLQSIQLCHQSNLT